MSKKTIIVFGLIILLISNILTFTISNSVSIKNHSRVIIPKDEYTELQSSYKKYSKIRLLEDMIMENYLGEVNEERLMEGQLKGLVQSLDDPYSQYLTSQDYSDMMEQTSGSFGGIGIVVTPGEDNLITVVSPIKNTPGERAGIKTGDKIIKVNGQEFTGESMEKAVRVMKGEPKTKVNLTIKRNRAGRDEIIDIEITREIIKIETVESHRIDNIGYIYISSFDKQTHGDFTKALKDLEKEKVKGLIIDLRNNPGGLLDSCVAIADDLLGEGIVVFTETKQGEKQYYKSKASHSKIPLVVLINEGSASASEILAGAIKDYNRGEIIGSRSFGKGVVQNIRKLDGGSGVKLTISEYFTPNGKSIHNIGVEPDIIVELSEEVEYIGIDNIEEDNQLEKAIEVLKSKL